MPRDILLDENAEIQIANGDFSIGESTIQHQFLLLLSSAGEFKASPTVGVDAYKYIEDYSFDNLNRKIRLQFSQDGMQVKKIITNSLSDIKIEAEYGTEN